MITAPDATIEISADGHLARAVLYAGAPTGLLLADVAGSRPSFWAALGERAECDGLSALAFCEPLPSRPGRMLAAAAQYMSQLGISHLVLVAAGHDASVALQACAAGLFRSVVLIDPRLRTDEYERLLAPVRIPKLVVVSSVDSEGQVAANTFYRHAIGPTAICHVPNACDDSIVPGGLPLEAVLEHVVAFAYRTCGASGAHME